jgi:phosphoglycolate phosphatase
VAGDRHDRAAHASAVRAAMTIKGVLFDKDGTLLDYAATWLPANRAAALAAARGNAALADRLLAVGGFDAQAGRIVPNTVLAAGTAAEIAALWLEHTPGWRPRELTALVDDIFEEVSGDVAVPVTDLAPLFRRLRQRGLRLGLATSDSRRGVDATLGRFGILDLLDYVAGYDSLAAGEVAVVGDNLPDLEMGRNAGVGLVVAVLSGTGGHADLAAHADHVLDSIEALEALLDAR